MEVIAKGKYIRISPKKAREIADLVRGKNAKESRAILKFMPHKGAAIIDKVLASAMANAENNFNLDKDTLVISKITIDGGPVLKRWQPRARGAAFEIRKRTSHITVVVNGDVTTKRSASSAQEKAAAPKKVEAKEVKEETKKESDRPEVVRKESKAPTQAVKQQVFRRKTG